MKLYLACLAWRKYAGIPQSHIYGEKKVKTVSAFENGRSTNIEHFEHYYGLAIAMGQKAEFEEFVQWQIERSKK